MLGAVAPARLCAVCVAILTIDRACARSPAFALNAGAVDSRADR
eukprot:COSAG06_NODE_1024_length_11038_cov_245.122406_12_plen_44_part_00